MKLSKQKLKDELVQTLEATLAALREAHQATRDGATHEEAKAENDKDTRAIEQQYLARGQAMRIEALAVGLAEVARMSVAAAEVVQVGALVDAEDDDGATVRFFIAVEGGGTKLKGGVQVLSPSSPLGQALLDKQAGDDVEVFIAGKPRAFSLLSIS